VATGAAVGAAVAVAVGAVVGATVGAGGGSAVAALVAAGADVAGDTLALGGAVGSPAALVQAISRNMNSDTASIPLLKPISGLFDEGRRTKDETSFRRSSFVLRHNRQGNLPSCASRV
jgi:hypothetical protein